MDSKNDKAHYDKQKQLAELVELLDKDFAILRKKIKEKEKDKDKEKEKPYDLDAQDENGKSALITLANESGYTEQMWVLLDFFADPNIRDKEGKTAWHYARLKDKKDMIICLLLFGADPEITDNEGHKPFDEYDSEELTKIIQTINYIKQDFIKLTRKRRKFLKYIFDKIDPSKTWNAETLADYYEIINEESHEVAREDALVFMSRAKLFKGTDTNIITFEEYIVALTKIAKVHGMKVVDDFIDRYKKIRVKVVEADPSEVKEKDKLDEK